MKHCGTILLETERLTLRRFTIEDAQAVYQNWAGDPQVTRYLIWSAHTSPEQTRRMVERWVRQYRRSDFYEWGMVEKASGTLIGSIGLAPIPGSRASAEAGYSLGRAWWNHGYATEALRAVLDLAVKRIGYKRIIAKHAIANPASGRVMQKAGMSLRVGEVVSVPAENGVYDCYLYEYPPPSRPHFFC